MAGNTSWLDYAIVGTIIVVGVAILYKALKEPIDLVGRGIKGIFVSAKDKISGVAERGSEIYYD